MSERTRMLKDGLHIKSTVFKEWSYSPMFKAPVVAKMAFRSGTKLCLERARLITESYKATEGQPESVRKARAFAHILDNMTIYILNGELLVGNFASDKYGVPFHPELGHEWLSEAVDDSLRDLVDDSGRQECKYIIKYWEGKKIVDKIKDALPRELIPYLTFNGEFFSDAARAGRTEDQMDFEKLLSKGINGVIDEVKQALEQLEASIGELDAGDYAERKETLKSMMVALEAGARFGKRYANEARELARKERDEKRRNELQKIAEICDWVPANPARTYWEALQSLLLVDRMDKYMDFHGQGFGNRLDTILEPFYQMEKEEGRITYESGVELMECFFIKLAEEGHLVHPNMVSASSGSYSWTDVTICGVTPEGDDATNEVSFIVLDAAKNLHLPMPTVALRYHPKIREDIIFKAIDVLRTGIGHPAFFNDSVAISWLMNRGVPLEKARDWGVPSCVDCQIPGENSRFYFAHMGVVNLSKSLELALYQGKDKPCFTGKQLGVKTPDPTAFTSIEDVIDAYLTQVRFVADKIAKCSWITYAVVGKYLKRPFLSAFTSGCIEEGKDACSIGHNLVTAVLNTGTTNVANSLAVIKKLVFDDKKITMKELVDACWNNWEGKEELRQMCINEAPKFGNDDDYVDLLARDVHVKSNAEFAKLKDYYGYPHELNGSIAGGYYGFSRSCGATPDGRKDSESLADSVLSPMAGTDKRGPTAVLKSVGKIPGTTYNLLFNQKFLPQFLEGENKKLFAKYIRTWSDLGIYHVQFNVVDKETLLDAQAHPENYSDLVVRVAGYSAYFVDLEKGQQNDIIARTEQSFA